MGSSSAVPRIALRARPFDAGTVGAVSASNTRSTIRTSNRSRPRAPPSRIARTSRAWA
jgi:hypothetical protein